MVVRQAPGGLKKLGSSADVATERSTQHAWVERAAQDKGEGAVDKLKGRAKEAAGSVTGDDNKKAEGRSDQTKGTAKEKLGKVKDVFK